MTIIDNFSLKLFYILIKFILKKKINVKQILILDNINSNFIIKILSYFFKLFNIQLIKAHFYSGKSFTEKHENIFVKSHELMDEISIKMAKNAINSNIWIDELNHYWKNDTILLFLSKCFYEDVQFKDHLVTKYLLSEMIARNAKKKINVFLNKPKYFNENLLNIKSKFIKVNWYQNTDISLKNNKFIYFLYISLKVTQAFINDFKNIFKKDLFTTNKPKLLMVQEDEISMDRSFRTQPHWLFPKRKYPNIEIIIINDNQVNNQNNLKLKNNNIFIFNIKKIQSLKIYSKEQKKVLKTLFYLLLNKKDKFTFKLLKLNIETFFYIGFCKKNNIKGFMTSENYLPISTSMNMISSKKILKTFSFQYSVLPRIGPIMQTSSDFMFTFSDMFNNRITKKGIKPKNFISTGYTYSSSFPSIKRKKRYYEKKLSKQKNDFIITYFDENFQSNDDQFGFFNKNDFCNEISKLVKFVNDHKNIKIITKTQFNYNSPLLHCKNNDLKKLIKDKRWFELSKKGQNRNIIFPSEAAICSDITIGHVVGCTSSLESALFGKRSILINPYKLNNQNTKILNKLDIIYPDLDSALKAINEFRKGNTKYENIGVWDEVLKFFDNYGDYYAARRMRNHIYSEILR